MRRSTKFYRKNEEDVMNKLGLVPTKNSGAGWKEKEDGQSDYVIAQLKSTHACSIPLKLHDFNILEANAMVSHKIPVFAIQFISTEEVFLIVKPNDLRSIADYLDYGKCEVVESLIPNIEPKSEVTKAIKTGDRTKFWENKEKERIACQKSLKSKR